MKTIYIDSDFKCYTSENEKAKRSVKTDFFDGMCSQFIEGYRFVPAGETWMRSDGHVFKGEADMISPWRPYKELSPAQTQYEFMLEEAAAAYREGVDSV